MRYPYRVPQPPPIISDLTWLRLLGSGGLADVHLYRQSVPAREVAVKVLRAGSGPTAREELAHEADAMAKLSGHPAIVSLYSAGESDDGRVYLVMEYCPVTDLGKRIRGEPLTVARALELMIQLCGGVEMAHRAGLAHCDIKPPNIMLTAYGHPALSDFGSATEFGHPVPGQRFSIPWAPPEQQFKVEAQPSLDLWALAATAWTMLAGRSPFEDLAGDNSAAAIAARVRSGSFPGLPCRDAPAELEAVLRSGMALDPGERVASALEFGSRLQRVQESLQLPVTGMDVQAGSVKAAPAPVDLEHTRVRGIQLATPVPNAGVATAPPEEQDGKAVARNGADQPASRRVRTLLIGVWAGIAAVVCAALVTVVFIGGGYTFQVVQPQENPKPLSPVDPPPAGVSGLAGSVSGGFVRWTWNDSPGSGLHYNYRVSAPGADIDQDSTAANSVKRPAVAQKMCIEVRAVDDQGRQSDPAEDCQDAGG
ncbi:MAG: serine/threonine protein kinase [Propionibacteriaceae bacterium]|jgi:predicted Ser/Thr protein kinase|nr:serine/threonine protein kinase [Propionibacteriaceae bacterium]